MSAVWQEELGDGANEEGLAERPFHQFQEGGLTSACSRHLLLRAYWWWLCLRCWFVEVAVRYIRRG